MTFSCAKFLAKNSSERSSFFHGPGPIIFPPLINRMHFVSNDINVFQARITQHEINRVVFCLPSYYHRMFHYLYPIVEFLV
jgi:hypothetical protein